MFNQIAFGEKLRNHRKIKGLTQEEVAEKIGVSGQAVSKWEKGDCLPDCYNLKMLGIIYQISVDTLLDTEELETIDPITGIFNKRHFLNYAHTLVEKARRRQENCYLLSMDIDNFKRINDNYGHKVGDKVLIELTSRIQSAIRSIDLFARFGADELVLFMTDTNDLGIQKAAERIRKHICDKKFEYGEVSLDITLCIGISKVIDFAMDKAIQNTMDKAMSDANNALISAKKDGRNRVRYSDFNLYSPRPSET